MIEEENAQDLLEIPEGPVKKKTKSFKTIAKIVEKDVQKIPDIPKECILKEDILNPLQPDANKSVLFGIASFFTAAVPTLENMDEKVKFKANVDANDLISSHDSQLRISNLLIFVALLLLSVATTLISLGDWEKRIEVSFHSSQNHVRPLVNPMKRTHLLLLNDLGKASSFKVDTSGRILGQAWSLTLPKSNHYFGVFHKDGILVLYGDGQKDMTLIKSDKLHRKVLKSRQGIMTGYFSLVVKVDDFIWLFGENRHEMADHSDRKSASLLWSLTKKRWLEGPKNPPD